MVLPPIMLAMGFGLDASRREWIFVAVLSVIGILGGRLTLEFRFGGVETPVSPDGVAWVLAAIVLPPPLAMLTCYAAVISVMRYGFWREFLNGGAVASSVGITSLVIHTLFPDIAASQVLLVGLFAALVFIALQVGEGLIILESRRRGAAKEHLNESWFVAGFEVFLPTIAIGLVAPILDEPLRVGGVLIAFQVITYAGLSVLKSEQVQRAKNVFLTDTFSRYVPATVVDQLTEEDAAVTLGGEEVEVSVMFADVRSFTSWSETLAPTEIIAELNEFLGELTQAVFDTGGTLDKFTGDGLMAFWGAPVHQPDHAQRACAAACDMFVRVDACNARRVADGKPALKIGVGVHSGWALVGNVGHEQRLDYTAIGDTVNLAARLEGETKTAKCSALISQATLDALDDRQAFGDLAPVGALTVKGRREPVQAYVLVPLDASSQHAV